MFCHYCVKQLPTQMDGILNHVIKNHGDFDVEEAQINSTLRKIKKNVVIPTSLISQLVMLLKLL
jgi:hypothetical protein